MNALQLCLRTSHTSPLLKAVTYFVLLMLLLILLSARFMLFRGKKVVTAEKKVPLKFKALVQYGV